MTMTSNRHEQKTIYIIGDGAAAINVYLTLLRPENQKRVENLNIVWYTKNKTGSRRPSRGVAYGPSVEGFHFLNSEAKSMSIEGYQKFPDWVREIPTQNLLSRYPEIDPNDLTEEAIQDAFLPRRLYGEYLDALMDQTVLPMSWNRRMSHETHLIGHTLAHRGSTAFVWCTGPRARVIFDPICDVSNPWNHDWSTTADRQNILVYGTGLTAIDAALSAFRAASPEQRSKLKITMASRSGRSPLLYIDCPNPDRELMNWVNSTGPHSVRELLKKAREVSATHHWNTFMKAMRYRWTTEWQNMDERERRRAMRVMPFYDIHRHKIVPAINRLINEIGDHLHVCKLSDIKDEESFDLLVNASGIDFNPNRVFSLHTSSKALGIDMSYGPWGFKNATTKCQIGPNSWCVGAHMKQVLGEATAMPEIRKMGSVVVDEVFNHFDRDY